jgi:hypothetical protein
MHCSGRLQVTIGEVKEEVVEAQKCDSRMENFIKEKGAVCPM